MKRYLLFLTLALSQCQPCQAALPLEDPANKAAVREALDIDNTDNTSDANKPVSTAQQTALNSRPSAELAGLRNSVNLTANAGVPVSVINIGDSFNVGLAGGADYVGQIAGSWRCGSATAGGDSLVTGITNDYAKSPDGTYQSIASGGNLTCAHLHTGTQGPANKIYYTLFPGTGTATLQYSIDGGSWITTSLSGHIIDTTAITGVQIGSITLPSFYQKIRSRVVASVGTINGWIGQGISDETGITYIGFATSGQDIGQTAQVTETVWKAMIAGYKHTGGAQVVVSTFADYRYVSVTSVTWPAGTQVWAVNGPMDTLRTWARTANSTCDWLILSPHAVDPGLNDTAFAFTDDLFTALGISSCTNDRLRDVDIQIRDWCERNGEAYVDGFSLFPDYLESYAEGIYGGGKIGTVSTATQSAGVVTVNLLAAHNIAVGSVFEIEVYSMTSTAGFNPNGKWSATATDADSLTFALPGAAGTYSGGFVNIPVGIASASQSAGVVTINTTIAHGWALNSRGGVRVAGITGHTGPNPNGRFYATATSTTQLTYPLASSAGTYSGAVATLNQEDGIHLSSKGKEYKRAHIATASNFRRLFSPAANNAGVRVGSQYLKPIIQHGGLGRSMMLLNAGAAVNTPGTLMAGAFAMVNPDTPQTSGSLWHQTGTNLTRLSQYAGASVSGLLQIRTADIHPVTNNGAKLGDMNNRFSALYSGGMTTGYVAVSNTYTVVKSDHLVHITAGTFNITLPIAYDPGGSGFNDLDAWSQKGRQLIFRNTGAGTVTVATSSSQRIDTATTLTVGPGETKRIVSVCGSNIAAADFGNWVTF